MQDHEHRLTSSSSCKETELEKENMRLRLVLEGTRAGLWDWNVQTGETFFDQRWARIAGFELSELEPVSIKTWTDLAHPEDLKKSEEMLSRHFSGELDNYDIEIRMRHKDGHWIWVHDRGRVTEWTEDGKPLRMTGTHVDITERKQSEAEIKHLNDVLRAIRNVNQLITHEKDRVALLEKTCLNLVENRGYYNAWIALLDEYGRLESLHHAGLGPDAAVLEKHMKSGGVLECKQKIMGREKLAVFTDPFTQCQACPLNESYESRAGISGRLEYQGRFFGLLSVSIPEHLAHNPVEHDLFQELAGDISFALFSLEREEERQEHLKNLHLFELIISTVKDPMSMVDRNYVYRIVNQAYLDVFSKKSLDEVVGRTVEELLGTKAFHRQVKPRLNRCLNGEEVHYEDWFDMPDGRRVCRSMSYYPYLSPDGDVLGVIVNARDITERKKQEEALCMSEKRFQKMLALVPDMVSIHDPDMNILYSNWNGFAAVPEEKRTLNTKCYKTYRGFDQVCPDCHAIKVFESKKAFEEEVMLPDGTWVDLRVIPILDFSNNIEMFVEWVRDITESKKSRNELIKARQKAEEANRAKSEFLANMSHELRTPLNGIMGMMQLLSKTELGTEQQEYVDLGYVSAKRLTKLLSDILDLSSIESGRMIIRRKELNINENLDSLSELFIIAAAEKGVSLDFRIDSDVPDTVLGDEVRLQQILFNLVGNAIKFTEQGKVDLDVCLLPHSDDKSVRLLFTVTDTGTGIPEDKLESLFQPFVQADGSMTRQYQGAGLGLVVVRRLVELMNGNISVDSKPGQGTSVYVSLPFDAAPSAVRRDESIAAHMDRIPESLRILLAEDDPLNQVFIKRILEKEGHKITLAMDGRQAVDLWNKEVFDCILMDIQMPVMTGVEATKRIRRLEKENAGILASWDTGIEKSEGKTGMLGQAEQSEAVPGSETQAFQHSSIPASQHSRIPIIAVTAHTQPGDREKFLEAGMDDYLGKPVSLEDFQRVLKKIDLKRI